MYYTFLLKYTVFLFFSFTASLVYSQNTLKLYVSPSGNDTFSGSDINTPFASIERAQKAIRDLKEQGLNQPVVVYLREGTYFLEKPLLFTDEDSGTADNPITYTAYSNEEVVISGGKAISGWKKYNTTIWMVEIPEVKKGWTFRQLYVNGSLRQRARTPNHGFLRVAGFPDGGPDVHYHTDCQRFEFAEGDLQANWTNLNDVEVIVYHFWTDSHLPLQSINEKSNIATFQHKAGKVFTDGFGSKKGARYIVENVWEGLDTPGEWYLNKKTGTLYYYPLPGEALNQVQVTAPYTPELIHLEGKPLLKRPIAYINFKRLRFEYTNWDLPPGNSNDSQGAASVPAAITLSGAQNCTFEECQVKNTGTFAFDILDGSQHNQISHCELSDLAAGGIRINGSDEKGPLLLRTGNNTIADNKIHHYGKVFSSAVGVLLMHANRNVVEHNEIHHGEYTGISVGRRWGYHRSVSTHNVIAYNHIHDIGGLLSDMGGIYTLGVSPGTIIRNNLIHDISAYQYGGWGIYNDEGTSKVLIENNIVYNTRFAPYNIHFGRQNIVNNNIFAFGKSEQISRGRKEPHKSVSFKHNIIYWTEGRLLSENWSKPSNQSSGNNNMRKIAEDNFEMDYNVYYNPNKPQNSVKFDGLTLEQWQQEGKDAHSVYAPPLFVDAAHQDFRLQTGSPALKLGFQPIDMTTVGVRKRK